MALPNQIVPFNVAASIEAVKQLSEIVSGLREQVFRPEHDYGIIPGTGNKPTLLLPGMEKLMRALRLRSEYHAVSITEDFDKGLFAYRYECRLIEYDTGLCVATAIGSCNSKESKYRWREQKRTCPKCQKETINRSKFTPKGNPNDEPGWYCYAKAGGCGAEFAATDTTITGQPIGKIENPDIFDQVNTIDKIAQKRALASAIKGAANVSEHFTVDLEDLYRYENVVEGQFTEVVEQPTIVDKATGEITEAPLVDQPQPALVEPEYVDRFANIRAAIDETGNYKVKDAQERHIPGTAHVVLTKSVSDAKKFREWLEKKFGADRIINVGNTWFDIHFDKPGVSTPANS